MKLLYVQFLQLLLILKASFMATSFPTKTDLPLHCLDGPNFDPDLQYPTSVQDTACRSSQSFCLRIEAGLAPLRENNATVISVMVGKCVKKQECNRAFCERFLADFWSINYTTSANNDEEISGENISGDGSIPNRVLDPFFAVRHCDVQCCPENNCNEKSISQIRNTETEGGMKKTDDGNGSSLVLSQSSSLIALSVLSLLIVDFLH